MKNWIKKIGVTSLAAGLLASLGATSAFAEETVSVGIVSGPAEEIWEIVVNEAAEEGIEVELELFTDYNQPNVALDNGSLDLNAFQHVAFLEDWNSANDGTLAPLGFTFVSPMGTYSEKISSLDELKDGDIIGIPNDPTNGGRAILALEIAGVIEVDDAAGALATPEDITDNPLNLKFEELDAAQLAATLPDVAVAIINTNFATDAGLSLKDAIFVDADYPDQLNELYKNVIAATEETKDNETLLRVVELYQTEAVAQAIYDLSNGGDKPIWDGAPVFGDEDSDSDEESTEEESEADSE